MKVAIVEYNAGNTLSVHNALQRLGCGDAFVSGDAAAIRAADKVIFPGVGEAGSAIRYLRSKQLDTLLCSLRQPVLGICLGLQLLCSFSEEGATECLGIFEGLRVARFAHGGKIPHMGWNSAHALTGPLFQGISEGSYFYFVHSYYAACSPATSAVTHYYNPFSAALEKDNFFAVQFHPEKSGRAGEQLLRNFLAL